MSVPARKGGAVGRFYQFGEDAGGCVGCSPVFVELRSASTQILLYVCIWGYDVYCMYVRRWMIGPSSSSLIVGTYLPLPRLSYRPEMSISR